jgi:hypothetical protein
MRSVKSNERLQPLRVVLSTLLLVGLASTHAAGQALNSVGIQPNEVKRGVAVDNAQIDLTMCASDLNVLQGASESAQLADIARSPECRAAIVRAQAAGMTKSQIVATLMGASGMADPNPGSAPAAGNPSAGGGTGGSGPN